MEHGRDDDRARAPVMQSAQEISGVNHRRDIANAVPRVIGRRRVEQRERDAGDELNRQTKEQHAAQREPPAGPRYQLFFQQVMTDDPKAGAIVEPVEELARPPHHNSTSRSDVCGLTRTATVSSPRGGGPATTLPSRS